MIFKVPLQPKRVCDSIVVSAHRGVMHYHGFFGVLQNRSSWDSAQTHWHHQGKGEPRSDIMSQGRHHNRCRGQWLQRNALGPPQQQNTSVMRSLSTYSGHVVCPDTWRVPSITICRWAWDGTESIRLSTHNLTFQHLWSEGSVQHSGKSSFPSQEKVMANQC